MTAPLTVPDVPVRARGVELLGELAGSGYRQAPGLVRRADGQTLQLTPLLYRLLELVDGTRTDAELAGALGDLLHRDVELGDVRVLLDRLRPLGLLRGADGGEPQLRKTDPLLALRWKVVVPDPRTTWRITTPFAWLFAPWVVVPVLAGFLASTWWLLLEKGLAAPTRAALYEPEMLLAVVALTVVSAAYHEFGHAAACRYGGARPGAMGAGLYLVWPAFYTDVDDSYRLSRRGRLRVDLGGLYFNAQVAVAAVGAWALLDEDALLLVVLTQLVQMVRQLAPFLRADGYHILADLTGVPDLFAHVGPTLRNLLPHRWRPRTRTPLKRWARVVVTTWVLVTVPLLLLLLGAAVYVLPRLAATAADSAGQHVAMLAAAAGEADAVRVLALVLQLVALCLPVLGIGYLLLRLGRQVVRRTWRATEDRPAARAAATTCGGLLLCLVAWAWWPGAAQYEPLRADDRGTLSDVVGPLAVSAPEPAPPPDVQPVAAAVPAPALGPVVPPRPEPAPVRRPMRLQATLPAAPAVGPPVPHVLRFALPEPPGEGDNQALAVGDTDGRHVFAGAYALVYVTDGSQVTARNDAYALATCVECSTRAVAFQVVLVVGGAQVVVPVNSAVAANDRCLQCLTTALAVQIVATLDALPDAAVEAELRRAMAPLNGLQGRSRAMDDAELVAEVAAVEAAVLGVLADSGLSAVQAGPLPAEALDTGTGRSEPVRDPLPAGTPSPLPSASPSFTASPSPSPPASASPSASPSTSPSRSASPSPAASLSPSSSVSPSASPSAYPSASLSP